MSQSVSTLLGLLASNGLPSDVYEILSRPPWNMSTIQQLANSFETKKDILSGLCEANKIFEGRGDLKGNLVQAWREAEAITAR
eukprot:9591381-Karenia_brevis.AAC.1